LSLDERGHLFFLFSERDLEAKTAGQPPTHNLLQLLGILVLEDARPEQLVGSVLICMLV